MQKNKINKKLLISSIILIPIFTLILALKKSPFEYNLSMVGSWFGYHAELIIWGIMTSIILTIFIVNIYKRTNFKNKTAYNFLYLSALSLIISTIIPMVSRIPVPMELRPYDLTLHLAFTILFGISLISSLILFCNHLNKTNKKLMKTSVKYLSILFGGSIMLILLFGFTGIFQIFFFIMLPISLIFIYRKI